MDGGYIWFVGLGACLIVLAISIAIGRMRRRQPGVGDPNAAWKQVARETGHPEVARPEK